MKRIKIVVISILIALFAVMMCPVADVAYASDSVSVTDYKIQIEAILKEFTSDSARQNRYAGSKEELNSAKYIAEKLTEYGLVPVNNQSTINGIQSFDFEKDRALYQSQNVVFQKKGKVSDKKVIIATHYDCEYFLDINEENEIVYVSGHGVSDSGASVATLLLISQALTFYNFDFDIEIVFFGAHNEDLAGSSYYSSFISNETADDILLMINLDNIVSDGKLYLYNGEFDNTIDEYIANSFAKNFNIGNLADYSILSNPTEESKSGLDYTHFALESDNVNFIRLGIQTLSPLSISDSNINSLGIIKNVPFVSVEDDTVENVKKLTDNKYLNNLSLIVNGVINLLTESQFKTKLMDFSSSELYMVLGNQKLWVFIMVITFIALWAFVMVMKYFMERKAFQVKNELQIDKVLSTITPKDLEDMDSLIERLTEQFEKVAKEKKSKEINNTKDKKDEEKSNKDETKSEKDDKQE